MNRPLIEVGAYDGDQRSKEKGGGIPLVVAQEKLDYLQESPEHVSTNTQRVRKDRAQKKERDRSRRKSLLTLILIVGVAAGVCAETIQLTVAKGAQIRSLEKDISGLKAHNDMLQVQVDKLRSVGRIESVALAMGMEKPTGTVYVAGALPAVKNSTGASAPPSVQMSEAKGQEASKPSALKELSQIFTSFFASTQR